MVAHGRWRWATSSPRPPASASMSTARRASIPWGPERRRVNGVPTALRRWKRLLGSQGIGALRVGVHEMFHPYHHPATRLAAVAQVGDEAGVGRGETPEARRRQAGAAEKAFYLSEQH